MPVVLRLHYDSAGAQVFVAYSSVPGSMLTYDVGTDTVSMSIPAGTFPPSSMLLAQLWFGQGADDVSGGNRVASLWETLVAVDGSLTTTFVNLFDIFTTVDMVLAPALPASPI